MTTSFTLAELGWAPDFLRQLDIDELSTTIPGRISTVHRSRVEVFSEQGTITLTPPPGLSTGEIAVGDWALFEGENLLRLLDRRTLLSRRAAGHGNARQLIAANVNTLFVVTSCNDDFNPARIERYLAMAGSAEVDPVILLTKADLIDNPDDWRARAEAIDPRITVCILNARAPEEAVAALSDWCRAGQTVALAGSSGVGKTTLTNALTGGSDATAAIRETDAKGRHTTTGRYLKPMQGGGWLIDMPGMRELRLTDADEGIAMVFDDIDALVRDCRFSDCAHKSEPGCAVRAALDDGRLDADRLARWEKLTLEEAHQSEARHETRARNRAFSKMVKTVTKGKAKRRTTR